jgi:hypothetical protein
MRPSLRPLIKNLEATYGNLGAAQLDEFSRLYEETSGFRHKDLQEMWCNLNESLCADDYVPIQKRNSMGTLFAGGDEFPDIFKGSPDSIDMNDLL